MIAPMKKVSIVCMKEDREKVLTALQHSALMMITASDTGVPGGDKESSERQRRVEQLLGELNKFGKKKGMFDQPEEVGQKEFDTLSDDTVALCDNIEALVERRNAVTAEIGSLNALIDSLRDWEALDVKAEDLKPTESTEILTGRIPTKDFVNFFLSISIPAFCQQITICLYADLAVGICRVTVIDHKADSVGVLHAHHVGCKNLMVGDGRTLYLGKGIIHLRILRYNGILPQRILGSIQP